MADALITTIIPTFRRPHLLKRAIESVLAQTLSGFKLCIYDNASGDETEAVATGYAREDARVHYFKNSENIGAVNNMIRGVESITTDFYSLLNDDDLILPKFYENAMNGFQKHPEAGFVCAKSLTVDLIRSKIHIRNRNWLPGLYEPTLKTTRKMHGSHFTQTGVVLRRGMRDAIGAFEKSGNDILYLTMAAASAPFVVSDSYDAIFLAHPQAYTASGGIGSEDITRLYRNYLAAVEGVMGMNIPDDRKVCVLALAANDYFRIFEDKKLEKLKAGKATGDSEVDSILDLPSRVNLANVLGEVYSAVPDRMHGLTTQGLRLVNGFDAVNRMRKRFKRPSRNAIDLPADVAKFFHDATSDAARMGAVIETIQARLNQKLR